MVDKVTLNLGTGGSDVATDDCGASGHAQIVKLAVSADGDATVLTGTAADGMLVNLGANNDVTVAGVATAAKQDTGNTSLATIAGAVSGAEVQVDVLTMPTVTVNAHAVTNAGTFAVQVDGAALTALQLIDDPVQVLGTDTYTEATSKGVTLGAVRRDADTSLVNTTNEFAPLQVDANGRLKVEAFSGETLPVSLTSTTVTGTVAVTQSGTWDEVGINDSGNSITVDAPVGTPVNVQIGNATLSAGVIDETGASAVDALAVGGGTAHDAVDSGNPLKLGAKVETSPKGMTLVADADRTNLYADSDGILMVKLNTSGADLISERVSNTDGTSTAFSNFSAVANTYNYVTAVSAFNSSAGAAYVDIRDGTAGAVLYTLYLPAGGGCVIPSGTTPLFKSSANTALAYDVSAATTTVYINMTGFQSKV